ncbi:MULTISPECIES: hypothetical protein [Paenibacillus]|uniref:Uncharacterized protein n=1 Tax=Paenibacillus xylanexedens TaxID=528191 RepID=A0ABS4RSA1_PAEXY|nr:MULTISPECIES: hypothetical protein [Paenibacillus]MBP2245306.1 hypothetical protein [Paenibacillus xylanexedens]SLJ98306.1 hypothetical protein SAMN06272722_102728 [Paenibacillus sp. RU5A]SOC66787.1 hypothetical protein SAMN05880581_102269 [Paenibacillus sp. RU26A]SOC70064.1 hypothetical protein SAMN05880586_102728 [Paenibacillus sp. RU5M]
MKIGIFLHGQLMIEYPNDGDQAVYTEALEDLKMAIEETGQFHELKLFEE